MTACSETTKNSFKDTINAIKPAGATNAAAGMELWGQTSSVPMQKDCDFLYRWYADDSK